MLARRDGGTNGFRGDPLYAAARPERSPGAEGAERRRVERHQRRAAGLRVPHALDRRVHSGDLILFSLYFYYKSSGIYFLLLVFASVSDYWIAHAIYKVRTQRAKYWLVGLSVLVNLGMLGYFKYTNFLIEIANNLFGQGFLNFQNRSE